MKRTLFFLFIIATVAIVFTRCKLDESYLKQYVDLNLTSWDLPNEGAVSVPFNLIVSASTDNTCYGKIVFQIEENSGKRYVYASSVYEESAEGCSNLVTENDSIMSITLNVAGKHYYYFLKENKWNKDSITILD